jgi:hypothetical protein
MKGSFVAWLRDDISKYTVKARGEEDSLAQLVETAFQEVRLNHRNSKGTREI